MNMDKNSINTKTGAISNLRKNSVKKNDYIIMGFLYFPRAFSKTDFRKTRVPSKEPGKVSPF